MSTPSTQQKHIIAHVDAHPATVVTAGAGTGKTTTLIHVIINLLEKGTFTANQFCLITFTREAAGELREKIQKAIFEKIQTGTNSAFWLEQNELLSLAFMGTIHSFCNWILKSHGYSETVPHESDTTITDYVLKQAVYDVVHEDYTLKDTPNATPEWHNTILEIANNREFKLEDWIVRGINTIQSRGFTVEKIVDETLAYQPQNDPADNKTRRDYFANLLKRCFEEYQQRKAADGLIDLNDMLLRTEHLLNQSTPLNTSIRQKIQQQYPCIFVDEFQDTDNAQSTIINALYPPAPNGPTPQYKILVVGDEKQAIYGFRGAQVRLLREFAANRGTKPIALSDTFRQHNALAQEIVQFFDSCDKRLHLGIKLGTPFKSARTPSTPQPNGISAPFIQMQPVTIQPRDTKEDQARIYARRIDKDILYLRSKGVPNKNMTVLVRSNQQLQQLLEVVNKQNAMSRFSYRLINEDSGSFWQTEIVLSIYRIIQWIVEGDRDGSIANLVYRSQLFKLDTLPDICTHLSTATTTPKTSTFALNGLGGAYKKIHEVVLDLREKSVKESGTLILDRLEIAFDNEIQQLSSQDYLNFKLLLQKVRDVFFKERALSIQQLYEWLHLQIITEQDESQAIFDQDDLYHDEDQNEDNNDHSTPIKIMTIHQAKGKTLPFVFLPYASRVLDGDFYLPDILVDQPRQQPNQQPSQQPRQPHGLDIFHDKIKSPTCKSDLYAQNIDRLEEEMRILYVAITRTAEKIYVYGHNRSSQIATAPNLQHSNSPIFAASQSNTQDSNPSNSTHSLADYWSWWDEFRYWNRTSKNRK